MGPDIPRTSTRISRRTSGGKNCGQALEILEKQAFRCGRPCLEGADVHDPWGVLKTNFEVSASPKRCDAPFLVSFRQVAERKFPEFFAPNFAPNCPCSFCQINGFSCFVSWETETRKNSPKTPGNFQCEIPRQVLKKKSTKVLWRAGKVSFLTKFPAGASARYPMLQHIADTHETGPKEFHRKHRAI